MMRYRIEAETEEGWGKVYSLHDEGTGTCAEVVPEAGFVWRSFVVEGTEFLYGARDRSKLPVGGMCPVLFPLVGRLRLGDGEGVYRYGGREYRMDMHGFAKDLPWGEVEVGADEGGAFVSAVLSEDEGTLSQYPFPFRFALTYRLADGRLSAEAEVESEGPFSLGFHPHFSLPGGRGSFRVRVPARSCWELRDLVPTGRKVPPKYPFYDGTKVAGEMDEVLTDLEPDGGTWRAELEGGGRVVRVEADEAFSEAVIFSPEGAPFLCIEPWTSPPNYLNREGIWGKGPYSLRAGWRVSVLGKGWAHGR